jgi:predicted amidohydrolase YtcJ
MSIFINGKVITLNGDQVKEAFCVHDGEFTAVGSSEEILALKSENEEVIDLKGKTVIPGFNDSHMHFLNYAVTKSRVQISEACSIKEIIEATRSYIEENNVAEGQWIISRGWNDNHLDEKRPLTRQDLDKISTKHPIFFSRVCGHIGTANSKALEVCGISSITRVPEGGVIDMEGNSPTGILRENAMGLIFENLPSMNKAEIKKTLKNAFEDALACGLTTIHTEDLGTAADLKELIQAYRELEADNELPLRFVLQLNLHNEKLIEEAKALKLTSEQGKKMLKLGVMKLYQDGSLGGKTAAMEEPYLDSNTKGVTIYTQEMLDKLVLQAQEAGFQIAIHAIGDRAMDMILNSYEKLKQLNPNMDLRPIIIHCQFTNSNLLDRFKQLGVIANVQPSFVMTDWPIVEKAVGINRAIESYNWKSMLNNSINLCFSSDAPIESFNPLYGIYAAVTRKDLNGSPLNGFLPEQKLTVLEALRCFTIGSAYMNYEEDYKGIIREGYLADFAILSEDILKSNPDTIKDIKVLETYVSGKKVY